MLVLSDAVGLHARDGPSRIGSRDEADNWLGDVLCASRSNTGFSLADGCSLTSLGNAVGSFWFCAAGSGILLANIVGMYSAMLEKRVFATGVLVLFEFTLHAVTGFSLTFNFFFF